MELKTMRLHILATVHYESSNQDWSDSPAWDMDATTDKVYDYLINDEGFMALFNSLKDWRQEELISVCVLDYFSSYEPVFAIGEENG